MKIELENFYSIKDRIRIDFRAANINTRLTKELRHNVIDWNGVPVLKSIGLFGPNASGKSSIINAISFCCRMILDSHLNNEGAAFNFEPFKFGGCSKRPSRFLIDFVCDNVEYEYSFSIVRSRILTESLHHYPHGRRAKVFTRDNGRYSFAAGGVMTKPSDVIPNTSDKNLFLSRASSMNRELAQKLYSYFNKQFLLGLVSINDIAVMNCFDSYKTLILKALQICDVDITDISARKEQATIPGALTGDAGLSYKLVDVLRFKTRHRNQDGVMFDLDLEESNGTRKLFQILIRLLDVVVNRKGIMLDEFDTGLHTRLADFILDLIHASDSSQLLFSSHNTNLIDTRRLRRDQIMFVNKLEDGSTHVNSLYDFKDFRENMDASKAYIQGRFDGVPYVDSSASSLRQLIKG